MYVIHSKAGTEMRCLETMIITEILRLKEMTPQGKPTLVPDNDKRPALNTAKEDFKEENENE